VSLLGKTTHQKIKQMIKVSSIFRLCVGLSGGGEWGKNEGTGRANQEKKYRRAILLTSPRETESESWGTEKGGNLRSSGKTEDRRPRFERGQLINTLQDPFGTGRRENSERYGGEEVEEESRGELRGLCLFNYSVLPAPSLCKWRHWKWGGGNGGGVGGRDVEEEIQARSLQNTLKDKSVKDRRARSDLTPHVNWEQIRDYSEGEG